MAAHICRTCTAIRSIFVGNLTISSNFRWMQPRIPFLASCSPQFVITVKGYAKKAAKGGKGGAKVERLYDILEVSTDPKYLAEFCAGSNYFKEGADVKLRPDEEYPDWLWSLHTGKAKDLSELDPETPQYWRRLRKMHMKRNNRLSKGKKF